MGNTNNLLPALREAVRQAIQTLNRMRDPDAAFLRNGARYAVMSDASLAYGYNQTSILHSPPSPAEVTRMETVLDWLGWLRRRFGSQPFLRVMAWANGVPAFILATREGCSQRTVHNRIDRSLNAILEEFGGESEELAEIEEPLEVDQSPTHFTTEVPRDTSGALGYGHPDAVGRSVPGKVFIFGVGFMRRGKLVRDGREKAERVS